MPLFSKISAKKEKERYFQDGKKEKSKLKIGIIIGKHFQIH